LPHTKYKKSSPIKKGCAKGGKREKNNEQGKEERKKEKAEKKEGKRKKRKNKKLGKEKNGGLAGGWKPPKNKLIGWGMFFRMFFAGAGYFFVFPSLKAIAGL
jgi:hypothetical protein